VNAARKLRKQVKALRRLARTNTVRVPALCGLFCVLLMLAIAYTRAPVGSLSAGGGGGGLGMGGAGGMAGAGGRGAGALATGNLPADDPVVQFAQTRVGQLLFASFWGDNCRRVLFDNRTGGSHEMGYVPCGQNADTPVEVSGMDRIQAMRKSFQKE